MHVNFLIVGTQKGGTTALAQFLSQHPHICFAPIKEVHFFDYDHNYTGGAAHYHTFFANYGGQPLVGEATPIYMYFPWIAERIATYNSKMKLIILLRNPTDRAYSHYQMERRRGWEWLPFALAIRWEPWRLRWASNYNQERSALRVHSYCDRGLYSRQIANLRKHFPQEQILILFQEELQNNHRQTLQQVYDFLEVPSISLFPEPAHVLSGQYPPMPPQDRQYLENFFTEEISTLAKLLDRDLDSWHS